MEIKLIPIIFDYCSNCDRIMKKWKCVIDQFVLNNFYRTAHKIVEFTQHLLITPEVERFGII